MRALAAVLALGTLAGWFAWWVERLTNRQLARELLDEQKRADAWRDEAAKAFQQLVQAPPRADRRHPSQRPPMVPESVWQDFVAEHREDFR